MVRVRDVLSISVNFNTFDTIFDNGNDRRIAFEKGNFNIERKGNSVGQIN